MRCVRCDWVERSNGRVNVSVFALGDSFDVVVQPGLEPTLAAREIGAANGLAVFLNATRASGAYSQGPGGAYSRLRTWEAVSGLLGRPWPAGISQLAAQIQDSRWISLEPVDPWFHDVAWDVFLGVVLPDRVVTIAATDTD